MGVYPLRKQRTNTENLERISRNTKIAKSRVILGLTFDNQSALQTPKHRIGGEDYTTSEKYGPLSHKIFGLYE